MHRRSKWLRLDHKLTAYPIPFPLPGLLNPPNSTENRNPDGQVKKLHVAANEVGNFNLPIQEQTTASRTHIVKLPWERTLKLLGSVQRHLTYANVAGKRVAPVRPSLEQVISSLCNGLRKSTCQSNVG